MSRGLVPLAAGTAVLVACVALTAWYPAEKATELGAKVRVMPVFAPHYMYAVLVGPFDMCCVGGLKWCVRGAVGTGEMRDVGPASG